MSELVVEIPEDVKHKMEIFSEINWPCFLKKIVERKLDQLFRMEELCKQLKEEEEITDWAVKLQRSSRRGRFDELKRRGLL